MLLIIQLLTDRTTPLDLTKAVLTITESVNVKDYLKVGALVRESH